MSGIATATIVGAGTSIYASHQQAGAARSAARARQQGLQRGIDAKERMFNRQMQLQQPYREAGYQMLPQLNMMATGQVPEFTQAETEELESLRQTGDLSSQEEERLGMLENRADQYAQLQEEGMPSAVDMMGPEQADVYNRLAQFTGGPLQEDPYYQWRQSEGENAINRAMAARGLQSSRPAINELSDYTRALTGEMTNRRYNRLGQQYNMAQGARSNQYNRLSQMANLGQGATSQGVQAAGQFGTNMANMYNQMGQAQAQGAMRQGNIQANMWSNLGAMPMNALSTYTTGKAAGVF